MLLGRLLSLNQKKRGELVRCIRSQLELTQKELAAKVGTRESRIAQLERGDVDLLVTELMELCLLIVKKTCPKIFS